MDRIGAAFAAVPRRLFLPRESRGRAGADHPLPIGYGQTNSQPRTVRDMLALLDVPPGAKVLDVGAGSGWTTALLAQLVGSDGEVIGAEIVPMLRAWGAGNLARLALPADNAQIVQARPGVLGWPDEAPYDRILVSANAETLPTELIDQLTDDGVMVVPVDGWMTRLTRTGTTYRVERFSRYLFVPLIT